MRVKWVLIDSQEQVEGAAVKASEMPEKVRKCWGEGGLDVRGLEGEEGESPLGAEDEEQVQVRRNRSLLLSISPHS